MFLSIAVAASIVFAVSDAPSVSIIVAGDIRERVTEKENEYEYHCLKDGSLTMVSVICAENQ